MLYIGGTGSFAAEVADWARAAGHHVSGLIELLDPERIGQRFHDLPAIGLTDLPEGSAGAIGVGGDRLSTWMALAAAGLTACAIVHPAAVLGGDVTVGPGAVLGPLAAVGAASSIGAHAIVSRGGLIGHHVTVGPYVTLNPGVNIGGNSTIGDGAFVGMGAIVVNGVAVGADAVIGAGAVVLRDVPAGARVQGVPARALAHAVP